jgi:hypothetical protein
MKKMSKREASLIVNRAMAQQPMVQGPDGELLDSFEQLVKLEGKLSRRERLRRRNDKAGEE